MIVSVATTAILAGGCTTTHRGRGSTPGRQPGPSAVVGPVNQLSYGVDSAAPTNWNILAAGADQRTLAPLADQVWLSVFTAGPDFNPVLNTAIVQSATQTSQSPQTVVYKINPRATWSDGTPVTGADFVYNWQAQSGAAGYTDTGGGRYTPADTGPYSQVKSVTVSAASPDTVTVVFNAPDPDWTGLFQHLMPAHVAQRIGFDSGFADPVADLVSDGPYLVRSYDPSGVVNLVRNPAFSGTPAAALELDVHYLPDADQLAQSLAAGQLSCGEVPSTAAGLSVLRASPTLSVKIGPGPSYLDLVFNATSGPMRNLDERSAVTRAVSRPAVISAALAGVDPQADPVGNRFLVPGEEGYTANPIPPSPAGKLPSGQQPPAALRLVIAASAPSAGTAAASLAQQLAPEGISLQVTQAATVPPAAAGSWDLALVERPLTPWPAEALARYQSGGAANTGGLTSNPVDTAITTALAAPRSLFHGLVDQVDVVAGGAYADLPLFALPQVVACQANVTGASTNASPDGPAYNAPGWGLTGGSS